MVGTDAAGLTWRDLDEHYPDLTFREVHDGGSVVKPSPAWWHQGIAGKLHGDALRWCAGWSDLLRTARRR